MPPTHTNPYSADRFSVRIAGIGASAGGLAALQRFLAAAPVRDGLSYIIVQHLDPSQGSLLVELLQRVTAMPVRAAEQGMRIQQNRVYVIPPDTELRVVDGHLDLSPPVEPRGMRLPINVLFSSLARTRGDRAIGVLLSGMGSDGTPGLQAIKAVGGLTLVQDPDTAEFDAMPRSAIAADCADIIASPGDMPGRLTGYLEHEKGAATDTPPTAGEAGPLERIVVLLRRKTRHDFSLYKSSTLQRRIARRMAIHGVDSMEQYASLLADSTAEVDLLFQELLIGVTGFFRDPAAWQCLAGTALPALLRAAREQGRGLRAWCIGCSTGEEPYSLAMLLQENIEQLPDTDAGDIDLQIFASDLNPDAIAIARRGEYPLSIREQLSPERLERFFTRVGGNYRVVESIRSRVLFAQHDVILDPPFTRLDLIICRNLLIYFDARLQQSLLPLFHYCLRDGGVLMLGNAETVGRSGQLFTPLNSLQRLYQRHAGSNVSGPALLLHSLPPLTHPMKEPPVSLPTDSDAPNDLQTAAEQVLLQIYTPPAVMLNGEGDIVYISGRTGKYLEPAAGRANWNFHAMEREGLRAPVAGAIRLAQEREEPVPLYALALETPTGTQHVDVTVHPLRSPPVLEGMVLVVFRDAESMPLRESDEAGSAVTVREAEQHQYQNEIIALREEARVTREQLQSSNEELQSTNEELQSANEELTTSKEEMQSMNEELQTINSELQSKLDDLALAQSDMKNVLNSIEIAVLFLDKELQVRRYTERAARLFSLREGDIGRPLRELTTILVYPELDEDALETLRTLQVSEKEIATSDDRWFTVRIMPYHRLDDVIDGVVITMLEITETKNLEQTLRDESAP